MNRQLLETAIEAARAAGGIIRAGWGQAHTVTLKGVINPVTEIDRAAEEAILKILRAATPDFGFLSEESEESRGSEDARWVIDPLDGTVNYAHHFPYFAVSIALERAGEPELGVIYDPMLDQLFTVERGRDSRLNGKAIHVSGATTLAESIVATGFPYDVWETGRNTAELARLARRAQTVRVNGCAALDFAYVACGRLDAYLDTGLSPWDAAAGKLLVEEAGGLVSFFGGDPQDIESQTMLATNGRIHEELAEVACEENVKRETPRGPFADLPRPRGSQDQGA